ncbi:hypothetical protein [Paraburkholderia sp. GAS42]|jgi:hypothetical protein|uniref:hypothetical protein n=1 Tax=Paraburkholderia sp. GAS42 TaxID=3035135 RepID=UPI003D23F982
MSALQRIARSGFCDVYTISVRSSQSRSIIKWLEGLAHLCALKPLCAQTQFVGLGDRETYVYELFAAREFNNLYRGD